jgi:mono/diheme cytochrome c family protein
MMRIRLPSLLLPLALAVVACKGYTPTSFDAPVKLGGVTVAPEVLAAGQRGYMLYCRACHGEKGDGKGPASAGQRPPPRDFTAAVFKFGAGPAGTLPHDEDLVRIVEGGLHGTAMVPWDVPRPTVLAIVQYLKTFSPRWKEETPGEVVAPTPDPWVGNAADGVARGRKLYHGLAQCLGCHPAYASRREIDAASRELTGNRTTDFRPDMYGASLKDSDFGIPLLAPDFTHADMRSVRERSRLEDIYRVIASGVGGTAMPAWKGSLPEADLWALAHYVESIAALKDRPEAKELLRRNELADASWSPSDTVKAGQAN